METDDPVAHPPADSLARRFAAACLGAALPAVAIYPGLSSTERYDLLHPLGHAVSSAVLAALAVVVIPFALRVRAGAVARALPVWLAAGACFASPWYERRSAAGWSPSEHPGLYLFGSGGIQYASLLFTVCVATAYVAVAAGAYAGASFVAGRSGKGSGGAEAVALGLAIAAVGTSMGTGWVATDLLRVLEHPETLVDARESIANQVGNASRVVAAIVVIAAARAGVVTAAHRGRQLAALALLPVLLAPAIVERVAVDRLVSGSWAAQAMVPGFELPRVAQAVRVEMLSGEQASVVVDEAGTVTVEGERVALDEAALASRIGSLYPPFVPPGDSEGGNVHCANQTIFVRVLEMAVDGRLSAASMRVVLAGAERADVSRVVLLARDARAPRVIGTSPLVRLTPPPLVPVEFVLSPVRRACPAPFHDVPLREVPALDAQAFLEALVVANVRGEPHVVYTTEHGATRRDRR